MGKYVLSGRKTRLFSRHLRRFALPVLVTMAVVVSLLFAIPTKAITITVTNPASGTIGSPYTFTLQVDVENTDLLPLQSIDLMIYNAASPGTYTVTFTNLPLP